jgi:nucleotide-binding universal stress UspA family protein
MTMPATLRPRPVVAGVDGSENSVRAALYAAEEARFRHAPLLLAFASPWRADDDPADFSSLLREGAESLLERAAATVRKSLGTAEVTTTVVDGYPVDALRDLSAEASLVVLGSRGVGGVAGLLVGSTASGVVHHARCPVIVLPEEDGDSPGRGPVVVGVEGHPDDQEVLAFAVGEAASRGADVVAVHAWRDVTLEAAVGGLGPYVDWTGVEAAEQLLLAESVSGWRDKEPDVEIVERVLRDRPATALLDAAATAGLLVVGHRHRRALARLGSTTNGVLHRARCPLGVVPLVKVGA